MRNFISKSISKILVKKNNILVKEIYSKNPNEYINKTKEFTLTKSNVTSWKQIFQDKSIVIYPEFLDSSLIENISKKLDEIYLYSQDFIQTKSNFKEFENIAYQIGDSKYDNHIKIKNFGKCLVLIRDDFDKGMIDIFNFQYLLTNSELENILNKMTDLSSKIDLKSEWEGVNVYINRNIKITRGFHSDSYSYRMKAFVYLTDVFTPNNGPYTYVYKSSLSRLYKIINKFLGIFLYKGTESLFFSKKSITPIYGKAGTLIISDQSEPHRGLPQTESGSRAILVINSGI